MAGWCGESAAAPCLPRPPQAGCRPRQLRARRRFEACGCVPTGPGLRCAGAGTRSRAPPGRPARTHVCVCMCVCVSSFVCVCVNFLAQTQANTDKQAQTNTGRQAGRQTERMTCRDREVHTRTTQTQTRLCHPTFGMRLTVASFLAAYSSMPENGL